MTAPRIELVAHGDTLVLPDDTLLMTIPCGEPYVAWWPLVDKVYVPRAAWDGRMSDGSRFPARATLACSLFDAVETGAIPHDHGDFVVILPDGTEFDYLNEMGPLYVRIPATATA